MTAWLVAALLLASPQEAHSEAGAFKLVATYRGPGASFASVVAPGPAPGSERLYASYLYYDDSLEVISLDPTSNTVQVYPNPARTESGARCMTVGPDGSVYLGTLPGAHFLKLDTKGQKLVDLGRPSETEQYIWGLTFASDGRLYGSTYPNAKLVRYTPSTGALEDLGRMDPVEQYGRNVAASSDGFVYVGIGTRKMNIAAYEIATGAHREILPEALRTEGTVQVYADAGGVVHAVAGNQHFQLRTWVADPVDARSAPARPPPTRARDGRLFALERGSFTVTDPKTGKTNSVPLAYAGRDLPIFRIAFGPDDRLYASSILPARLLRLDEERSRFEELGDLGDGEIYSFLRRDDRLLMAGYACKAPLMAYRPDAPLVPGQNPALVTWSGGEESWRPVALVDGPDGKVYAGGRPGYGKVGAQLRAWDVAKAVVEDHPSPVPDQSISALVTWNKLLLGGTNIEGGMGTRPVAKEAKLFLWDPAVKKVVWEAAPVPGATAIENLVIAPNGLAYAIAGGKLAVVDVAARSVRALKSLPFPGGTSHGALRIGPDGRLWGLGMHPNAGIFAVDTRSNDVTLVARPPKPITAGFEIRGRFLYFASGADVYRYEMPAGPSDHPGGGSRNEPDPARPKKPE